MVMGPCQAGVGFWTEVALAAGGLAGPCWVVDMAADHIREHWDGPSAVWGHLGLLVTGGVSLREARCCSWVVVRVTHEKVKVRVRERAVWKRQVRRVGDVARMGPRQML